MMKIHTQWMSPRQGGITPVSWLDWEPYWDISHFLHVSPACPATAGKAMGWQQHRTPLLPQPKLKGKGMAVLACKSRP